MMVNETEYYNIYYLKYDSHNIIYHLKLPMIYYGKLITLQQNVSKISKYIAGTSHAKSEISWVSHYAIVSILQILT